jgi:hypothetical protein
MVEIAALSADVWQLQVSRRLSLDLQEPAKRCNI